MARELKASVTNNEQKARFMAWRKHTRGVRTGTGGSAFMRMGTVVRTCAVEWVEGAADGECLAIQASTRHE